MNNENLKPFKPGQCGNPKGRPKGSKSLTGILRAYMDKELEIDDPIEKKRVKKRIGDIINLKLISNAIKGDDRAIKQNAYTEGRSNHYTQDILREYHHKSR